MLAEHRAQPRAAGGEVAGEERMVLREARAGAEGLGPHRARQVLGQRHEGRPALGGVGAGADHERGRLRLLEQRGELVDGLGRGGARAQQALGAGHLVGLGRGGVPVVHRHDDQRGAASADRRVVGAHERPGHVLGAGGLLDRNGVLAGQALQAPGEEGLLSEVPAVLLADHDHQRRAVDARRGQGRDGVAQPRRGVQQGEGRLAAPDGEARGHAHDRALVQRQHEAQVVGEAGEEGDLGRAGIGEDRRQPEPAQDVEGGVAHGRRRRPPVARRRDVRCGPRALACHRRHSNPVR